MTETSRKRFGQHFLTDRRVLAQLMDAFAPARGQRVLEIGPGRGALTDALAGRVAHITAVEIDRELAAHLRRRYAPQQVRVVRADILRFSLSEAGAGADEQLRVIGNLPYNISTPLLFHLLAQAGMIRDMLFMLQREVALRLAAAPGGKNYGRLSVMAARLADCELLFDVPAAAFAPPPKVASSVVRITPKKNPAQARAQPVFEAVVAAAFGQRRKTLRNALAALAGPAHFARAGVDSSLRAEALSPGQFIALADALCAPD
ncbi:MAG: 16S rRNA (adenine(1518)-N(6)/adenine(1519)-N(6))-dimethyltransferase RsmA [Gammaproteobacteria bacterium]